MSLDISHFQNPKMAIIRLLRSQCLCKNGQPCNDKGHNQQKKGSQEQSLGLLKYREQLQLKVSRQRSKLNQIPCVITLAQQIQQVKQIISGLTRQNRQRIEHVKMLQRQLQQDKVQYYHHSTQEQGDIVEHERLQIEYAGLLRTLEMTNDENQRLIKRLAMNQ